MLSNRYFFLYEKNKHSSKPLNFRERQLNTEVDLPRC